MREPLCPWCVVPHKEGEVRAHADIEEFLDGRKRAVLLDNNVLASEWGLMQIEKIVRMGIRVDFNQGLDARRIARTPEIALRCSHGSNGYVFCAWPTTAVPCRTTFIKP
ncbi:MAG: hypothetical protein ACLUQ6_13735 [Alistipes onderdonkii]